MNRILAILLAGTLAAVCGCDRGPSLEQEEEGIRSAINAYLREERGINPDAMQMQLAQLKIDGDRAHVLARFSSGASASPVEFRYSLERAVSGWKVVGTQGGGHGGEAAPSLPDGHPPLPAEPPADQPSSPSDS